MFLEVDGVGLQVGMEGEVEKSNLNWLRITEVKGSGSSWSSLASVFYFNYP